LEGHGEEKVLAVGCPFCKSMLESTPGKGEASAIAVKDVAELLLESVLRRAGESVLPRSAGSAGGAAVVEVPVVEPKAVAAVEAAATVEAPEVVIPVVVRKKWSPKAGVVSVQPAVEPSAAVEPVPPSAPVVEAEPLEVAGSVETVGSAPVRKKWEPKKSVKPPDSGA
jgi:hypothetical protein